MRRVAITLSALLAVGLVGCGGGGPGRTAADATADGWELFEQGLYEDALEKFHEAVGLDADYSDAYNGLGWSHGKLDSLGQALDAFSECISSGMTTADPYAGQAPVYRDLDPPQFVSARQAAEQAYAKARRYVFSHYTTFDWRDLFLIRAQCYYALNDFLVAKAMVDSLGGTALNPASPNFARDLAAEIERLEGLYGG